MNGATRMRMNETAHSGNDAKKKMERASERTRVYVRAEDADIEERVVRAIGGEADFEAEKNEEAAAELDDGAEPPHERGRRHAALGEHGGKGRHVGKLGKATREKDPAHGEQADEGDGVVAGRGAAIDERGFGGCA